MKKRIIALILALTMSLSMLPVDTFAMETELPEEAESSAVEPAAEMEEASEAEELPVEEIEVETESEAETVEIEQPAEPQEESAPEEENEEEAVETEEITEPEPAEAEEAELLNATVASGTCGAKLTWTLDAEGILTISGTGSMTSYDASEMSGVEFWVTTAPWRKYFSKIKKLQIQSGVISVGRYAFFGCYNIESISIPQSVVSIYSRAFGCCNSLKSANISAEYIGEWAFASCDNLTSVTLTNNVHTIALRAFQHCTKLKSINIPDSVTSIGSCAFSSCESLTNINIPSSVTSIGEYAFDYGASLESIQVAANNPSYSSVDGVLFNKNKTTLICYPSGKKTETYSIPQGVISIGDWAFVNNKLKSINIPSSVSSIGKAAFVDCQAQPVITFAGNAPSIGDYAFQGVTAIICYPANNLTWTQTVKNQCEESVNASITWKATGKKNNTITVSSCTKTYSTKAQSISLNATAKGNAKLTYKSDNSKIKVSTSGKVTIPAKFIGKATITVTASETTNYKKTTKKITVTVNPTKTTLSSVSGRKTSVVVKWKKNTVGTGYEIWLSENADFSAYYRVDTKKNTYTQWTVNKLPAKKKFYVKIRTYKTVNGIRYYSGWSTVKSTQTK